MAWRCSRGGCRRRFTVLTASWLLLGVATACDGDGRDEPKREAEKAAEPASPEPASEPARPTDPREQESIDGYRVVRAKTKSGELTAIKLKPPEGWDVMPVPRTPDPQGGTFALKEALAGLGPKKKGKLAAKIETSMGSFYCDLFEDEAPRTVANFVGLARGLRKFWDADTLEWVARPYYDGTTFHRVIPRFMIQGGDHTGTGRGGIGYRIDDELRPELKHDRAGRLSMANRGPNTGEAQFFITEAPSPQLDGVYTIFGQCEPVGLVQRIARVPQSGAPKNRPLTPVVIEHVTVERVAGGAASWMPPGAAKAAQLPGVLPPGRAVKAGSE